jgi:hypothetical protein
MANIKTYTLDYEYKAQVVVEIDYDIIKGELLHEINNFWSDAGQRLDDCDHKILKVVLRLLATTALREELMSCRAVSSFKNGTMEGWPKLDGSCGIKLIEVEKLIFEDSDINIKCDGVYL